MVSFEVPLTFYCKIGEIPSAASPQKIQEQIPESLQIRRPLMQNPDQFYIKYQSPQMVNIALIFLNIGGGGVAPRNPPTRDKKSSSRIIPCISGENSCITYPPRRGFHNKKCENSRKYQHQSARNGIRIHHLHPFFQKKKKPTGEDTPPPLQEEKILSRLY